MKLWSRIALCTALVSLALTSAGAEVPSAKQVNDDPGQVRNHIFPALAVDPTDSSHLVAINLKRTGLNNTYGACISYVSRNAGESWTQAELPLPANLACRKVAPDVAFGKDGAVHFAYYGTLTGTTSPVGSTPQSQLYVATSLDGGSSVASLVAVPGSAFQTLGSRTSVVTANPTHMSMAADPATGAIYVAWNAGVGASLIWISRSLDGGKTFAEPVVVAPPLYRSGGGVSSHRPKLAVGGGRVFLSFIWLSWGELTQPASLGSSWWRSLMFSVSDNQGATFSIPQTVDIFPGYDGTATNDMAVDFEGGRTNVYMVYDHTIEGTPNLVSYFAASSDGGTTWRRAARFADTPAGAAFPEERPSVSVAPDGRIDIAWYDGRNDPFSPQYACATPVTEPGAVCQGRDIYYTYSLDGGRTFSPDVRMTSATFSAATRTVNNSRTRVDTLGTIGLASGASAAAVMWEQAGPTATVAVAGAAPRTVTMWDIYAARAIVAGVTR